MSAGPTALGPAKGPTLSKEASAPGPALDPGTSKRSPVLVPGRAWGAQLPTLSVLPYVLGGVLLAALVMAPLLYLASSRSGEAQDPDAQPWYWSLVENAQRLFAQEEAQDEVLQEASEPPPAEPVAAALPEGVPAQIAALVGKNCQNFLEGGDDPAAQHAFDKLVWSRLSKEWQDSAAERLDLCTPFQWQTPTVLSVMACAQGACGSDDVKFYITRDGKVGVDVTANGNCTYASEEGFAPTELLCTR